MWGRPNRPNEKNVKKPDVQAGGVRGTGEGAGARKLKKNESVRPARAGVYAQEVVLPQPQPNKGEDLFCLMSRLTSLRRFKCTEAAGDMLSWSRAHILAAPIPSGVMRMVRRGHVLGVRSGLVVKRVM